MCMKPREGLCYSAIFMLTEQCVITKASVRKLHCFLQPHILLFLDISSVVGLSQCLDELFRLLTSEVSVRGLAGAGLIKSFLRKTVEKDDGSETSRAAASNTAGFLWLLHLCKKA